MKYQPLRSPSFLSVGGCFRADVNWVSPTSFSQSVPIPESGLSSALRLCWESIHLSGARCDSLQLPACPPLNLSTLGLASSSHCSCPSRTSLLPPSCQSVLHQQEERALKNGCLVLAPNLQLCNSCPLPSGESLNSQDGFRIFHGASCLPFQQPLSPPTCPT